MMRMYKKTVGWILLFVLPAPCGSLQAQEQNPKQTKESCRQFVQGFYNWYVRKLESGVGVDAALRYKKYVLSAELVRLLKIDQQSRLHDDNDYLDWDPLTQFPEPVKRCVTGNVRIDGDRGWVDIDCSLHGEKILKDSKPRVVAELRFKDERWLFVNFHYRKDSKNPVEDSLLSVLKHMHPNPRR